MPHDSKGNRVHIGDWIITKPYNYNAGKLVVGRVETITEAETCSGQVSWQSFGAIKSDYFGLNESTLVLRADGSKPEVATDAHANMES